MKNIIILLLVIFPLRMVAQQEDRPALYVLNPYLYNSACSGFVNGLNLSLSYSNQRLGMEGSPQEWIGSAHKLLRGTNFSAGGVMSYEKIGVSDVLELEISGTYRFLVTDWTWLSLNVGGGFRHLDKDFSLLRQDNDSYFTKQAEREIVPRFRMGAWMRFDKDAYLSFSVKGVGNGHMRSFGHKQSTHYYLSGGKSFRTRPNHFVLLNAMMFVAKYSPIGIVVTPSYRVDEAWEFGISYQIGSAVSPYSKFVYKEKFFLGCHYEVTLNRMSRAGNVSSFVLTLGIHYLRDDTKKERIFRNAPA